MPAPVLWQIRRPNCADTELSALGISRCTRKLVSQDLDTCEIVFGSLKPVVAATTMPYDTVVSILRDGVPWFTGCVLPRAPSASGSAETSRITLAGPWRHLQRLTYRQIGLFLLNPLVATDATAAAPTAAGTIAPTAGLITTISDPAAAPTVVLNPTGILYGQSIGFVPVSGPGQNIPGFSEFRPATSGTPALPTAVPGAVVTSKKQPDGTSEVTYATGTPSIQTVTPAAAGAVPVNYVTTAQLSAKVIVGQDEAGTLVSGSESLRAVIQYCLDACAADAQPFQVGEILPDIQIPAQEINTQTCADIIRRVLAWAKDVTCWFDYATLPPTLHIVKRADRAAVTLVAGDAGDGLTNCSLTPLPDLILPGVTLEYRRTYNQGGITPPPYQQIDQAGPDPVGFGALVAVFELSGSGGTNADGSASTVGEQAPVGLAQRIWESRQALEWRGSVTLVEEELLNRAPWPGRTLNVVGVEDAWATMAAQVQSSEEEILSATTTLTLGPPDQLGASDFLALANAARQRVPVNPTTSIIRTNGPTPAPPTLPAPVPTGGGGGGGSGGGGGNGPQDNGPATFGAVPPPGPNQEDHALASLALPGRTCSGASFGPGGQPRIETQAGALDTTSPPPAGYSVPISLTAEAGACSQNQGGTIRRDVSLESGLNGFGTSNPWHPGHFGYNGTNEWTSSESTSGVDLRGYSKLKYAKIEAIGTASYTGGPSGGTGVTVDLTGSAGRVVEVRAPAGPSGSDAPNSRQGFNRASTVIVTAIRVTRR